MSSSRDDFLITINKQENFVSVVDDAGKEIKLPFIYPTVENSKYFWDCAYNLMQIYSEVKDKELTMDNINDIDKNTEEFNNLTKFAGAIIPSLTLYIGKNIETTHNIKLSKDQQDNLYILINRNLEKILAAFVDVFKNLLPQAESNNNGDTKKN